MFLIDLKDYMADFTGKVTKMFATNWQKLPAII